MASRIMLFGSGGQVGRHLIETAVRSGHDVVALTHRQVDICDAKAVAAAIAAHALSSIVNTAAYTAVDKAESEADRAFAVNRDGAALVATAAALANIPLVHLATDCLRRLGPRGVPGGRSGQPARRLRPEQGGGRARRKSRP